MHWDKVTGGRVRGDGVGVGRERERERERVQSFGSWHMVKVKIATVGSELSEL